MKENFSKIPAFLLAIAIIFAVSGFVFPKITTAQTAGNELGLCNTGMGTITTTTKDKCSGSWSSISSLPQELREPIENNINNPGYVEKIFHNALAGLVTIILKFVSLLTAIGGLALNGVIYHTVVKVSENYAALPAINEAWKVVRDVANMGFIFVLLYAAIQTILGIGSDAKKLIVNIVVVAILINFSLFATKVIIDISNILALLFYDAIVPGAAAKGLTGTGLSNAFMQNLNLQNLYFVKDAGNLTVMAIITTGIMGSIMLLIAAFVFFAVAIMFIIRYVVLILVLILSPIAFVSFVLPGLNGKFKEWWSALSGQAFFAPIYFMLTWVTLVILGGLTKSNVFGQNGGNLANVGTLGLNTAGGVNNFQGFFPTFINFAVVIVFLIASLLISKKWADSTGAGVGKLTSWATGAAGGATLGMAGRFGRGTFGRAGGALAENEKLRDVASKGGAKGIAARLALATSRKTAGASFDLRGSAIGGQLDAGKAQKGGFAADLKKKVEAEKKYADETFKPSTLTVVRAEQALANAKNTGTPADIDRAQGELDRISGASEDALRQRKIKEFRARGDTKQQARVKVDSLEDQYLHEVNTLTENGMAREEAEKEAERRVGWSPKAIESLTNIRKGAYAKAREAPATVNMPVPFTAKKIPLSFTGRALLGVTGRVNRERLEEANAIRKSMKEKKPGEKIAEEIEKQSREATEGAGEAGATTPPATPPTQPAPPTGGSTPTP